ncbi:hypothetical protein B0H13DRAFT_1604189 [Mycena leptocephala]|nr:hypothetical protein B0H13DRAFT_1604189 [Mycena leptocephala]
MDATHSGVKLIVDVEGRIVAALLGRPEGDDWDEVIREFERVMEGVRLRGVRRGILKAQNRKHHRGFYYLMGSGVTRGPGQNKPGNLKHSKKYRQLLQLLILNHYICRIVGFQSSGMARYAPKLYHIFSTTLKGIYENQPELEQLFSNSIFPAATWNLGPNVVTEEHNDLLNFGMCGITSAGDYDHKLGGHIHMKQLKVVCEFPSGSSILIPSAAVTHSNTPIAKGETRYSMTQYAAGALFQWAAYGYQSAKSLLAQVGGRRRSS